MSAPNELPTREQGGKEELSSLAASCIKSYNACTIEDIFASISTVQAASLAAPPCHVALTPRSAEACLRHGVNPETLRLRDVDSFWEFGVDRSILRMRHEAYCQRRHDLMRQVRTERQKLLVAEQLEREAAQGVGGMNQPATAAERILAEQAKLNIAAIDLEKSRLEKMQSKQEREIAQLVAFEQKMTELQIEVNRKREIEQQKAEARDRARQKRLRELAEERRIKELRKKAQEDAEEERRLQLARKVFKRNQELQEEREAAEKEARMQAQMRDEERLRKAEEHRLQTQKILAKQQELVKQKMLDMEEAEKVRREKVHHMLEENRQKILERRKELELRLEVNLEMAKRVEEKRREDFFVKQKENETRRAAHTLEQDKQAQLHQEQQLLLDKKRQLILQQAKDNELKRKKAITDKFVQDEEHVLYLNQLRERENMLQKEGKHLKLALKRDSVERVKRVKEYRRMEIHRKIRDADMRMKFMQQQKQDIIDARKRTAVHTKQQRDALMQLVERAKTCVGERAIKRLQRGIRRQLRLGLRAKVNCGRKQVQAGSTRRHDPADGEKWGQAINEMSDLAPKAPTLLERLAKDAHQGEVPSPAAYVSPYESNDCAPIRTRQKSFTVTL